MFENLQEERLDNLQEDLVSCIEGDEGQGGRKHHSFILKFVGLLKNRFKNVRFGPNN